jgi:tetratricopeptide (TPR) repeat protein
MNYTTYIAISILGLSCAFTHANDGKKEKVHVSDSASLELEKALYIASIERGDALTAQTTAARLILMDPEDATKWKQELCKLLFLGRNFEGALKLCEEILKNPPTETASQLRELQASCQEALGLKEAAKKSWSLVFQESKNPLHAVRLGGLQFESSEFQDALITIEAGLLGADVDKLLVTIPKSEKEMQQVPAAAALLNLKGLVVLKKDPEAKAAARAAFEAALKVFPDFVVAKGNLGSLDPQPPVDEATSATGKVMDESSQPSKVESAPPRSSPEAPKTSLGK